MLKRALFISIAFHLVVLLSLRHVTQFGEPVSRAENAVINALLLAPGHGGLPPPASALNSIPPPTKSSAAVAENTPKPRLGREKPVLPSFSRSTATGDVTMSDTAAVSSHEAVTAAGAAAAPKDEVSPDGVRQYRLNLAREARRFKRYPPLARQRGWEGVVVVLVSTVASGLVPQVSLSQSSGFELLDQEALELVSQAAHTATVPESLRNRQFGLTLPIHYRLDD